MHVLAVQLFPFAGAFFDHVVEAVVTDGAQIQFDVFADDHCVDTVALCLMAYLYRCQGQYRIRRRCEWTQMMLVHLRARWAKESSPFHETVLSEKQS